MIFEHALEGRGPDLPDDIEGRLGKDALKGAKPIYIYNDQRCQDFCMLFVGDEPISKSYTDKWFKEAEDEGAI